jgi:sulfur-oxidizing protein SoxY
MEVNASKMSDVTNISFLVQENSTPLAASFNLSGAVGFVSTRIKMGKTSEVDALVTAGGSTTKVTKEVKVTIGGCGG